MAKPKEAVLTVVHSALGILDFVVVTAAVVVVTPFFVSRFYPLKPGESLAMIEPLTRFIAHVTRPFAGLVSRLPHTYRGEDATPFYFAAVFAVLSYACSAARRQIRVDLMTMEELDRVAEAEEVLKAARADDQIAAIKAAAPSDREKVLEIYNASKQFLESQRRRVAFLAIDVVGSTAMKQGEDPAVAERDFLHYRKLVETAIARYQALKGAWTPDGAMICFPTVEHAVAAGQEIIRSLVPFNASTRGMKTEFKVRCGVNAGDVMYDQAQPMERMADASIDLTGHLQKYAEPNTIFAAKAAVDLVAAKWGFKPAGRQVDGVDVMSWSA